MKRKNSPEFIKLRPKIKRRDNFCCQFGKYCKIPTRLEVHHIDCNYKNNNPDNLITLCRQCHMFFHNCIDDTFKLNIHQYLDYAIDFLKLQKENDYLLVSNFCEENKIEKSKLYFAIRVCKKYFSEEI